MPIQKRIHDLRRLLTAFIEQPDFGILVVRCSDDEILYLTHTLEQLDSTSPADCFFIAPDPFSSSNYIDSLERRVSAETGEDIPPPTPGATRVRVPNMVDRLEMRIPPGDHRLVCALIPTRIDDPTALNELIEALLSRPFSERIRLVLREDPTRPSSAASNPSRQIVVYNFTLPASLVVQATAATACDPSLPPDERAQAILQLAVREAGFGHYDRALAAMELAVGLAQHPALVALIMAFRADALHAFGDPAAAFACASQSLRSSVAAQSPPAIYHSAMSLGEAALALERRQDAATCFKLAERSAVNNPNAATLARERLSATQVDPHADPRHIPD